MNEILQLIGSVASIGGIPLAIYLYLKSQVQKYSDVRREIVKRLSYQVGESRSISLFEVNAIIDSLVRERRLKPGTITADSIAEDLIAETVSSPLLDRSRKDELVAQLQEVHSLGGFYQAILDNEPLYRDYLESQTLGGDEVSDKREGLKESIPQEATEKTSSRADLVFGIAATIGVTLTAVGSYSSFTEGLEFISNDFKNNMLIGVLAGGVVSAIAGAITAIVNNKNKGKQNA